MLPDAPTGSSTIPVTELFSGQAYQRDPAELRSSGLVAVVDAFSTQIFKY